jgi:hypothetical protein
VIRNRNKIHEQRFHKDNQECERNRGFPEDLQPDQKERNIQAEIYNRLQIHPDMEDRRKPAGHQLGDPDKPTGIHMSRDDECIERDAVDE